MSNDAGGGPKTSLDVSVGKQIDAALADVIRGLLKRPSETVGDLVADGIGIVGDRIKRKREHNAKLGLEEVRKRLADDDVDMKDITPPKEEELHLLMNGMSLTDDEKVREMWAGLFAKALEPDSQIMAERPFISVLESLTPLDAKVIDLLAFFETAEREFKANADWYRPRDFKTITHEDQSRLIEAKRHNDELREAAIPEIREKAEDYGLLNPSIPGWSDNLIRQGVIERTPFPLFERISGLDLDIHGRRDLGQVLQATHASLRDLQTASMRQTSSPEDVFSEHTLQGLLGLEVRLTAFGRRLASACGLG